MHHGKENEHRHKIIRKNEGAAPLYIIKRENRVGPRTCIGNCVSVSFVLCYLAGWVGRGVCVWGGGRGSRVPCGVKLVLEF